jgi:ABC-type nitrate/sulfonate/bicarbonate transport system substrate-binding protein
MPSAGKNRGARGRGRINGKQLAAVAAVLATVAAAGCSSSGKGGGSVASTSGGKKTYHLTALTTTTFGELPLNIAVDDIAPKYGLTVTLQNVNGGGTISTEFQGGTGNLALTDAGAAIRLEQKNAVTGGVTIFGTNIANLDYAIAAKSSAPYSSLAALKGKTIAITSPGALSQYAVAWAVQKIAGLSTTDVKTVPLGPAQTILQSLQHGAVDAGTLYDPALSAGLADKSIKIVQDLRQYPFATGVFVARQNDLKADPTPYKLFLQSYNQAIAKLDASPSYALQEAEKYYGTGATTATLKAELATSEKYYWRTSTFPESLFNSTKQLLIESGDFKSAGFPTYQQITQNASLAQPAASSDTPSASASS